MSLKDEYHGRQNGREAAVLNDTGLCDVSGADDFPADLKDLFFLVPAFVDIEVDSERGREHGRREILRVVSRLLFGLPEGVMFANVTVHSPVGGNGATDGSHEQSARLIAAAAAEDAIGDGAGLQFAQALGL